MTTTKQPEAIAESTKETRPDFVPGLYKHYKGGLYKALFLVRDCTYNEAKDRLLVIYLSLTNGELFARPLFGEASSWSDSVLLEKGGWVQRFSAVSEITQSDVPPDGTA